MHDYIYITLMCWYFVVCIKVTNGRRDRFESKVKRFVIPFSIINKYTILFSADWISIAQLFKCEGIANLTSILSRTRQSITSHLSNFQCSPSVMRMLTSIHPFHKEQPGEFKVIRFTISRREANYTNYFSL